jgi:hypothetical protein
VVLTSASLSGEAVDSSRRFRLTPKDSCMSHAERQDYNCLGTQAWRDLAH